MENESNKKIILTSTRWSTLCCLDDIINIPINKHLLVYFIFIYLPPWSHGLWEDLRHVG